MTIDLSICMFTNRRRENLAGAIGRANALVRCELDLESDLAGEGARANTGLPRNAPELVSIPARWRHGSWRRRTP